MKNNFKDNLSLKLISLLIAFIVWGTIMNIEKPIVNGFVNLPLSIENEDAIYEQNKTYTVLDPRICKINFKGHSDKVQLVRQSDFKAYIDLKELGTSGILPVHYKAYNNVDNYIGDIEVEPKEVKVELSDISRVEKKVEYTIKGDLDENHSIGSVILSPNVVYVSGSEQDLKHIDKVMIEIPINNQDEMISGVAKIKLYEKDGKELKKEGILTSVDEINYSVVIFIKKSVAVNAVVEGTVKKGYSYAGVVVYPNSIIINGPRSVVDNIYTIDLPAINIEEMSSDASFVYSTKDILPAGLTCSTTDTINVKVSINDNVINKPETDSDDVGPHIIIPSLEKIKESLAASETEETTETEKAEEQ